jgi:hypothetical protein
MDAFRADAFSAVTLTVAVDKLGYAPQYLGTVPGLFNDTPVRTTAVWIEERSNAPALIQTTERAAAPKVRGAEQRTARAFRTKTLDEGSRIMADELQGIRAFGSETEMKTLMSEVARRQQLIKNDMELTKENWRLGVIQGSCSMQTAPCSTTGMRNSANRRRQFRSAERESRVRRASPAVQPRGSPHQACPLGRRRRQCQDQRGCRRQVLGRADLAPRGAADLPQLECRGRAAGRQRLEGFPVGRYQLV